MEQMEVTPVPLDDDDDDDNGGNMNFISSNSLTPNDVNNVSNSSVDAIAIHSENDKSDLPVNEGPALKIENSNNSSVPCESEKLPEMFDNIQLDNDLHSEAVKRNADLKAGSGSTGNETVINCVGKCKSEFHNMDVTCPIKSLTTPVNECRPSASGEKIQNVVCSAVANSMGFTTPSLSENSSITKDFPNHIQTAKDGATEMTCEAQIIQSCNSETESDLSEAGAARKESDVNGKPFQFDSLQKQTSEIKERVMGFLTKYSVTDEASCSGAVSISKQDCVNGKQTQVTNVKNSGSKIAWEDQCEPVYPKKASNDFTTQNQGEAVPASSQMPTFHLASPSKKSVTENCSPTSNVCSSPNNIFNQQKDAINQKTICTTFIPLVPSQGSFNFSVSNDETLTSNLVSSSCKYESTSKTSNDIMKNHNPDNSSESNMDVCSFQSNGDKKLNSFEQGMTQNCKSFNLKSDVQSTSVCGTPGKNGKGNQQQNELNSDNMSVEYLYPSRNDSYEYKMQCSPNQKQYQSSFLNATSMNHVTCTFQKRTNTEPVNSWLSWGKMSGELHTTPSINSPILSSKSSNDSSSSKHIPFLNNSFSPNTWPDNTELSPNTGSNSRRTRSSDQMFFNIPNPFSNGATAFSGNGTSKSQKCDNLSLGKAGEINETNLSHSSFDDLGNTSKIPFIPQHNINNSSQGMFGNCQGKSTNFVFGETLHSDLKCFERPFGNNHNTVNMENPFTKKTPIESIGLFKLPIKSAVCEGENSDFKPVVHLERMELFPFEREKGEERNGNENVTGILKPATSNDPFGLQLGIKQKCNQTTHTSAEFAFTNSCPSESFASSNKKVASCGQISKEDINEQTPFGNLDTVPSQKNSNLCFQFTFTPEKLKTFCTSTETLPRPRRPLRTTKQFQNVGLKDVKSNPRSNVFGKGTEENAFKPVYGSDVKFEKGMNKNVIIRYQNIVFMDEYSHVSPEELRSQFYTKAVVSGPFKFGACIESHENLSQGFKKTQSQGIQTDEQLASKNPDLTAIWRVLECPVCLDVVLPPVYQCEQGHHACSTCWTKVLTCPLCKRPQSCTRNYMAEALVEQVPLPCRYHIEGCKETVQHNSKVNHEENCSYRMYQCPVPMCNQALSYQNMCKHFKKNHKNILHHEGHSVGKGEKFCDVLYKEALLSSVIHAFDITKWGLFFLREVAVGRSTAFFVQVMPAASDQAVYFYHLEVCDHHDCRKECFKGRVFPMCKPSQEIIDQEEYLCLSELILKTVKKTTPLKIVVTIWQLKPAFTLSS